MMKLFKPTLGKKMFLLLLVSFYFVNILNVFWIFERKVLLINLENFICRFIQSVTSGLF